MGFHDCLFGGGPFNHLCWVPRNRVGLHTLFWDAFQGLGTLIMGFHLLIWGCFLGTLWNLLYMASAEHSKNWDPSNPSQIQSGQTSENHFV